jgi:hypothetical protein
MAAVTYGEADLNVYSLLSEVMRKDHQALAILDPELRIKIMMASGKAIPCLKKFGVASVFDIKISPAEERADRDAEPPDVRFLIDRFLWDGLKEIRKRSLLSLMLAYLDIETHVHESSNKLCCDLDDYGRPVIGKKAPDFLAAGFIDVAARYEGDSWEHIMVKRVIEELGQESFGFMKADTETDADAAPDQSAVVARVAELEREADGEGDSEAEQECEAIPSSVSFSGKDFDAIAKVGKALRRKSASQPAMAAAE